MEKGFFCLEKMQTLFTKTKPHFLCNIINHEVGKAKNDAHELNWYLERNTVVFID